MKIPVILLISIFLYLAIDNCEVNAEPIYGKMLSKGINMFGKLAKSGKLGKLGKSIGKFTKFGKFGKSRSNRRSSSGGYGHDESDYMPRNKGGRYGMNSYRRG